MADGFRAYAHARRMGVLLALAGALGWWSWWNARPGQTPSWSADASTPAVPAVSLAWLLSQKARGQVVLADVRTRQAFDYGHIEGAISWPLETPEDQKAPVPAAVSGARQLVLYGRGGCGTCGGAAELDWQAALGQSKIQASVYSGGFAEWMGCRLPVDASDDLRNDMKRGLR
jgi:rhodanese-related sulfurtransferase